MVGPDRVPVRDALGVVPHPVAVDDAGRRPRSVIASIRPSTCAGTPVTIRFGGGAQPRRPVRPDQVVVAADAAGGDDHRLRAQLEVADRHARADASPRSTCRRLQHRAADAVDRTAVGHAARRPGAGTGADHPAGCDGSRDPSLERLDHAGAGAPGDVEAGHRVAVPVGARSRRARPSRRPGSSATPCACSQDRFSPAAKSTYASAHCRGQWSSRSRSKPARAQPVLPGQVERVLDAHPALLGRVDEEQPAERPERLPAEVLLRAPGRAGSPGGRRRPARPWRPARPAPRRRRHVGVHVTPSSGHPPRGMLSPIVSQTPACRRRGLPSLLPAWCRARTSESSFRNDRTFDHSGGLPFRTGAMRISRPILSIRCSGRSPPRRRSALRMRPEYVAPGT